ncbi:hypothetical protein GE115_14435 [Agromyces sp. CFH 90414]|uniref:Uncharacterized protein n=1 Tax=Agromyces agglutinans TaxID=2662258 RepID=A0A6I2F9R3_9MICO|nr:hypothetical protein [Agromyces agglutinans]MRG61051.1 hypothetical protein [Agromyces agglutinans]
MPIERTPATRAVPPPAAPPTERGARGARPTSGARGIRSLAIGAIVASATMAVIGIAWLLLPELDPFASGVLSSLATALFGPHAAAALAAALGLGGVLLGIAVARTARPLHNAAPIAVGGLVIAVGLAFGFGSFAVIAFAGYLFGLAAVIAGAATVVVLLFRRPRLGVPLLAALLALLAAAVWLAGLTLEGVVEFAREFGDTLVGTMGDLAVSALAVATTVLWVAVAFRVLHGTPALRRVEGWLVRHRRMLAVLAALGPVPYLLARLTWLTPWPQFGPDAEAMEPAVLATGLMLGAGAAAASLLTLGLILPWGRVFPTWIPRVGGRPVPVPAGTIPGFAAAGVLCVAAGPLLAMAFADGSFAEAMTLALVLPLWFWGPMLALAVSAYRAWRIDDDRAAASAR